MSGIRICSDGKEINLQLSPEGPTGKIFYNCKHFQPLYVQAKMLTFTHQDKQHTLRNI